MSYILLNYNKLLGDVVHSGRDKQRLLPSDNSAKKIAAELGCTDPSHFLRTFKKVYWCTMQKFRKRSSFQQLNSRNCASVAAG